jgi:small neutral amino acid transporter SnatA (MarC family)
MADRNLRDEISNLEERVEALAESLERCRKIMLASKISMIVGGILMLTILLGLFGFDPVAMIVAATAIIGGIVLFGSTRTTANQISAAMRGAELCRTKLISKLELRTVEESLDGET